MQLEASEIAALIEGKVEGDKTKVVKNAASLENATDSDLSFLANLKYEHLLYKTKAGIVIIADNYSLKENIPAVIIRCSNPYLSFGKILEHFSKSVIKQKKGISANAQINKVELPKDCYIGDFTYISNTATISENVKIFPQVFIGENVKIGPNTIIYPGVKIYDNTIIGADCIIHANAVIGSDGFGFAPLANGSFHKIPQVGNVIIEDNVEVGANTVLDKGTLGATIIKKGSKLDNLIQIAHNVEIGENTVIAAQAGVSGSTKIGKNCMIGGQAGFVGHITIAPFTKINAQSGVSKTVKKEGKALTGSPAFDYIENLRAQAIFKKLPELEKRVSELEKLSDSREKT
ncbi:MAG: UDP-3-O-(3-hydroxymyristoyl)glucosamine N-acyltransferase [Chitinophagaceae bacterium]|nr:MAG: UDP-3-O-(3-hydroxymyristoyl)glucosamine N-acyltransferase [Chitinophagaceae bacterium]